MLAVEEFLDDGKDVFRLYPYLSFLHTLGFKVHAFTLFKSGAIERQADRLSIQSGKCGQRVQ